MKKLLSVLIFIIFISSVLAIRINEVEMNPINGGEGKEWIELYNDESEDVNISEWEVWEGIVSRAVKPKKIQSIPEGTIIEGKSFFIFECQNKLNNEGDFVILYDEEGKEIDRTETMKDSEWSVETWQLCGSWEFLETTKGKENKCEEEETPEESEEGEPEEGEPPEQENDEEDEEDTKEIIEITGRTAEDPENQSREETNRIILNPQSIKIETNSGEVSKNYAVYSFIAFSVLLALLFLMKRRKYENEFT